jgi:type I restriction enzyme S subunit
MMLIRPKPNCLPKFLALTLNAPQTVATVKALTGGTASPHLNVGDVRRFQLPLPPVDEQKRIVAKVERLMMLCDDLETKLRKAETTAAKLMEAVISEMVGVT